jgi:hypothetical protein
LAVAVVSAPALDDYVEVNERLAEFHAKYPNGSLQSEWEQIQIGDQPFIVATAYAYRDPYDVRPGIGTAWEPFPGRTPFTKGSELMNAETSAWGRAIASLGFKVKRSVASAEEVRAAHEAAAPIDNDRAQTILAGIKGKSMDYKSIDLMLGACGLDALRARSPKALSERIESLTEDEAKRIEEWFNRG